MDIKQGIKSIMENDLETMREAFNTVLITKAIEKLEEKKIEVAEAYFNTKE